MDNLFPLQPQIPLDVRAQEILICQPLDMMMLVSENALSRRLLFPAAPLPGSACWSLKEQSGSEGAQSIGVLMGRGELGLEQ